MKTKLLKKIVCISMSLMMITAVTAGTYTANAKETQESLQNKIDNAQDQIRENNEKKKNINDDMSEIEDRIESTEAEVSKLESEVADANSELQKASNELEKGNEDLGKRLRTIYKSGSMGFIDVILSSDNVADLFSNFSMVQYIFKNDKNIVSDLKEKHEEMSKIAKDLQNKQKTLNAKQTELNADYSQLADAKADIQSENKNLQNKIEDWRADSAALEDMINNSTGGSSGGGYQPPPSVSGQGFIWPCAAGGYTSREFGSFDPRWDVIPHLGKDIAGIPYGSAIVASKAGRVIFAGWQGTYGNLVVIDHGNGISTAYAHNSGFAVSAGQNVSQGQTIAYAGSTGNSSGVHCHFEVRINGKAVDPRGYL